MKDKDLYFRGACSSCDCQEYANDGRINCADCKCTASRHRISYWGQQLLPLPTSKPKKPYYTLKSFNPFNWISFQWLSVLNPFYWLALTWTAFGQLKFPSFISKKGKKLSPDYKTSVVKHIKTLYVKVFDETPKLWSDLVQAIPDLTNISDIDQSLPIVQEFRKRLTLALPTLGALVMLGILGFRGGHLSFPVVNELYGCTIFKMLILVMSIFLIIAAASSHYVYLTSPSLRKRSLSVVLLGINVLSLLVYFLVYLGVTPKLYGPAGAPIQTARFLEWNVSLPCWAQLYSLLITGQESNIWVISRIQLFIISLLISSGQISPICEIVGGFAFCTLGTILLDLEYTFISKNAESNSLEHKTTAWTINKILYWSMSLVICTWTLGLFTILHFPETELFYSFADVGSKCAFTALVLSADVDKLYAIANKNHIPKTQ